MARVLKTGTVYGNYRILSELGSGGLGRVFKAVHLQNQNIVALKVISDRFYRNKRFIGIFHREMMTHSELKHKNIVRWHECMHKEPLCYIATEFIDGWSGSQFIKRNRRRIPPVVALSVIYQILQGLDHLHLRDKVHSDLSAGNFLVERTGRVVLTDFGLSSEINDHKNYLVGTPGYYSPEHINNTGITRGSDTYCVGLLLYELVVGTRAVPASKDRHLVLKEMSNLSPSFFAQNIVCADHAMKSMLIQMLTRALSFFQNKRYPSAERMLYDCSFVLGRFKVRRPRHTVLGFLEQAGMVDSPDSNNKQHGSAVQTITQDERFKAS
ncbi:MAG: serine/threonine-protein kinase [Pseudomonadota bacterium]|nr:serine/threonine-protein kinase [Pseudomonadota bacterium]